MEAKYR